MFTIFCMILVIIGAINWFSIGVADFNIINWIFTPEYYVGARVIYALVGIAAMWLLFYLAYNKFNSRAINAPERVMYDKMNGRERGEHSHHRA